MAFSFLEYGFLDRYLQMFFNCPNIWTFNIIKCKCRRDIPPIDKRQNFYYYESEDKMMTYIISLGLGLAFLYTLRDGLLVLQNKRDALEAQKAYPTNIIHANGEQCKQNKLSA